MTTLRTRLAPSPTGALHLGNARTFLLTWLWARASGAKVVLRIEDIDGPRVKKGAAEQALDDLRWLGLDWDEGPFVQTERQALYHEARTKLIEARAAYACVCTRKEVEAAASAPNEGDEPPPYPGTCRAGVKVEGRSPAWRFLVPEGQVGFTDLVAGEKSFDVARSLGDFVIAKNDGQAAYQLAVVVDDAAMDVTHVIRGDDLVPSTPRQLLLYRALGLREPAFAHLPLVVGEDGRRLAKRHGDTRIATYREKRVRAERLVGLLAAWSGLVPAGTEVAASELVTGFALERVARERITFHAKDDAWLRA